MRADVVALAVLGGWIVHLEKNLQQLGRRHLARVVLELNGLGVARVPSADLHKNVSDATGKGLRNYYKRKRVFEVGPYTTMSPGEVLVEVRKEEKGN